MASHDLRSNDSNKPLEPALDHPLTIFELLTMSDSGDHESQHVLQLTRESDMADIGPHLLTRIGGPSGTRIACMVDTGSLGILVGREYIGREFIETGLPFEIVYSSSGVTNKGTWVIAPVTFISASSEHPLEVTTVHMLVRASDTGSPAMLGVGFDRGSSVDPAGHPVPRNINPFLMLPDMLHGSVKPGYIISSTTTDTSTSYFVTLGITEDNTSDFMFVALEPKPDLSDWVAPNVHLTLQQGDTIHRTFLASLLVDTGLNTSLITGPSNLQVETDSNGHLQPGSKINITSVEDNLSLYDFTVIDHKHDDDKLPPDFITWRRAEPPKITEFVNTSRHALNVFDYLFDSQWGRLGFRFKDAGSA